MPPHCTRNYRGLRFGFARAGFFFGVGFFFGIAAASVGSGNPAVDFLPPFFFFAIPIPFWCEPNHSSTVFRMAYSVWLFLTHDIRPGRPSDFSP